VAMLLLVITGCSSSKDPTSPTKSSEKAITSFSLNGVAGAINETVKTVTVSMPSLTNVTTLVATFTTTGASVKIGSTAQDSEVTVNSFTDPLAYTVIAADGSTITYSVTVAVNRVWHHPASLSDNISPDVQDAWFPQVAMDKNGNAIIVWSQSDGANSQIFKSEYRNGVWHHPVSLSDNISPDGQDAGNPQVAMDNNGNAIIVWRQYNNIYKSEYRNGAWHHPANLSDKINPPPSSDAGGTLHLERVPGNPMVAMDNNGNAIIVWMQSEMELISSMNGVETFKSYSQIFKSEYRNGVWTHPASIADNISLNLADAFKPQVAMDDNGNAIIVWYQDYSTNVLCHNIYPCSYDRIFKSEYRNGIWTHPANLSDSISPDGQWAEYPQVAMDNNGNAIIVWSQSDGTNSQIFKSEYRNSTWTNPANLSDNISPDGQRAEYLQVAMDNNGNVIIVWQQSDGIRKQIFKSEYRNGVWHNPANLSDNISLDGQDPSTSYLLEYPPQVAMNNNGNAIIVWQQSDGANWQIFKSEYR